MGTGSFRGVKRGRGVTLTPQPLLVPWSWKGRATPLLPLWAVRTVQSLSVCTEVHFTFTFYVRLTKLNGPPMWSSGQSFWLQIQRSRLRFPALPDFLSSRGSGTGSTQPRDVNWGATWIKKVAAPVQKTEINGRGDPLRWPRDTPLSAKVSTNFADRRRPLCRYSSLAD